MISYNPSSCGMMTSQLSRFTVLASALASGRDHGETIKKGSHWWFTSGIQRLFKHHETTFFATACQIWHESTSNFKTRGTLLVSPCQLQLIAPCGQRKRVPLLYHVPHLSVPLDETHAIISCHARLVIFDDPMPSCCHGHEEFQNPHRICRDVNSTKGSKEKFEVGGLAGQEFVAAMLERSLGAHHAHFETSQSVVMWGSTSDQVYSTSCSRSELCSSACMNVHHKSWCFQRSPYILSLSVPKPEGKWNMA